VPHLIQNGKPCLDFNVWYATLDKWDRTMIYASQLKKYLLVDVSYNKWGDINRMLPGLLMDKVTETPKLSDLPSTTPEVATALSGQ
jgi:hypothetical protein